MDKNFMPVHTYQLNQIYAAIDAALQTKAFYIDDSPSLEYRSWSTDLGAGPIHITISRCLIATLNLQTRVKIEVDHEKALDTFIKSDKEIDQILQIVRCLNPERLKNLNDELPDLIDDTDYLLDERYKWITPDFSGLEECPFDFV